MLAFSFLPKLKIPIFYLSIFKTELVLKENTCDLKQTVS